MMMASKCCGCGMRSLGTLPLPWGTFWPKVFERERLGEDFWKSGTALKNEGPAMAGR
jgi:hypothetical protein